MTALTRLSTSFIYELRDTFTCRYLRDDLWKVSWGLFYLGQLITSCSALLSLLLLFFIWRRKTLDLPPKQSRSHTYFFFVWFEFTALWACQWIFPPSLSLRHWHAHMLNAAAKRIQHHGNTRRVLNKWISVGFQRSSCRDVTMHTFWPQSTSMQLDEEQHAEFFSLHLLRVQCHGWNMSWLEQEGNSEIRREDSLTHLPKETDH